MDNYIKQYKEIKAVETNEFVNFCTSCNTQVELEKFVKVVEGETIDINNKVKIRVGVCQVCKKIYWFKDNNI